MLAVCRKSGVDLTMPGHLTASGRLLLERGGSIDNKHRRSSTISFFRKRRFFVGGSLPASYWTAVQCCHPFLALLHCPHAKYTTARRVIYVTKTELRNYYNQDLDGTGVTRSFAASPLISSCINKMQRIGAHYHTLGVFLLSDDDGSRTEQIVSQFKLDGDKITYEILRQGYRARESSQSPGAH